MTLDYFYGQTGELFSFYRIPNVLNTHINRLRLKLKNGEEDTTTYIKTLWGIGYKMEDK